MDARKIIRFGNSSHVVSVPKAWIQENKLKKGDIVYFEQNSNGELVLWPKEKDEEKEKKITIDVNGKNIKAIEREILAAYIKGFNILTVTSPDIKKKTSEIKKMLKNLVGIEILEKNSKEIVAADFLDVKNISLKGIIKRMDTNIRSMFEDLNSCLKEGEIPIEYSNDIYETDYDVNKFYFLLWKITVMSLNNPALLHKLKTDSVEVMHTWWLGMSMEKIGDELKRITRDLTTKKFKKDTIKKLFDTFVLIKKNYFDVVNAYYKNDVGLAYGIMSTKKDVIGLCDSIYDFNSTAGKITEKLKTIQTQVHNIAKCTIYFT